MKKTNPFLVRNIVFAAMTLLSGAACAETKAACTGVVSMSETTYGDDDRAEAARYLMVWDNGGGLVSFPLEERPCIVTDVKKQQITFTTSSDVIHVPLNEVHKYTLEAEDLAAIEETVTDEGSFGRNSNDLTFDNFAPGSVISVYTIDGMKVTSDNIDADGHLSISMEGWNTGVYIIKTESASYKIIKK